MLGKIISRAGNFVFGQRHPRHLGSAVLPSFLFFSIPLDEFIFCFLNRTVMFFRDVFVCVFVDVR